MNTMQLSIAPRQSQTLSPRQQHAVQLLQMASLDFTAMVHGKIDENPFLENEEDEQISGTGPAGDTQADEAQPAVNSPGDDRALWMSDKLSSNPANASGATALDLRASETTLTMHLHSQLNVMTLSERDLLLTRAIVESLDEDGYLRSPLEDIAGLMAPEMHVKPVELSIALKLVQSLEPTGVAARNVAECLLLQCPDIQDDHLRQLAQRMVEHHMDALAAHDVPRLCKVLNTTAPHVQAAIDSIRQLSPRPGWSVGASHTDYVTPDVIVGRHEDGWSVQLNPAVVPKVKLNQVYEDLFRRHRTANQGALTAQLQDAHWTLRNVHQRFTTILGVAQAIVRKQHLFLQYGAMAMKPLLLRDIADELGMHESTVSRVTSNKYMATPLGVFELKYFFSRPMHSASGKAYSATAIRELIAELITAEDPARPLSDGDITRQLGQQGLLVARRTVTKYRQLLRIEAVEKRRRHD